MFKLIGNYLKTFYLNEKYFIFAPFNFYIFSNKLKNSFEKI